MNSTSANIVATFDADSCDPTNNFFQALGCITGSQGFVLVIYIIGGILSFGACVAQCHKTCVRKRIKNLQCLCNIYPNDNTKPLTLVYFAFSWMDYMSDWAWAIEVYTQPVSQMWKIIAGLGVVVPYVVNLFCAALFITYLIKQNKKYQTECDQWIKKNSRKFLLGVALTGNGEPVLQLFNSKIFNLSLFSMNLRHKKLYYDSKICNIVLNFLIEKVPQLTIQIMFFMQHPMIYTQVTVIATLFSGIGLFLTCLQSLHLCCINNQFREERIELTFLFEGINNCNHNGLVRPSLSLNKVNSGSGLNVNVNVNPDRKNDRNNRHNKRTNQKRASLVNSRSKTTTSPCVIGYHKIIDQVFGLTKYITQSFVAKNFNFGKYSLVCQFVEKNCQKNYVKMMLEVLTDDEYKQNKLTDKYLKKKLARSKILINGINKLIGKIYVYECGSAWGKASPIRVRSIKARVISNVGSSSLVIQMEKTEKRILKSTSEHDEDNNNNDDDGDISATDRDRDRDRSLSINYNVEYQDSQVGRRSLSQSRRDQDIQMHLQVRRNGEYTNVALFEGSNVAPLGLLSHLQSLQATGTDENNTIASKPRMKDLPRKSISKSHSVNINANESKKIAINNININSTNEGICCAVVNGVDNSKCSDHSVPLANESPIVCTMENSRGQSLRAMSASKSKSIKLVCGRVTPVTPRTPRTPSHPDPATATVSATTVRQLQREDITTSASATFNGYNDAQAPCATTILGTQISDTDNCNLSTTTQTLIQSARKNANTANSGSHDEKVSNVKGHEIDMDKINDNNNDNNNNDNNNSRNDTTRSQERDINININTNTNTNESSTSPATAIMTITQTVGDDDSAVPSNTASNVMSNVNAIKNSMNQSNCDEVLSLDGSIAIATKELERESKKERETHRQRKVEGAGT